MKSYQVAVLEIEVPSGDQFLAASGGRVTTPRGIAVVQLPEPRSVHLMAVVIVAIVLVRRIRLSRV